MEWNQSTKWPLLMGIAILVVAAVLLLVFWQTWLGWIALAFAAVQGGLVFFLYRKAKQRDL